MFAPLVAVPEHGDVAHLVGQSLGLVQHFGPHRDISTTAPLKNY